MFNKNKPLFVIAALAILVTGLIFNAAVRSQQFDQRLNRIQQIQAELTDTALSAEDRESIKRKLEIAEEEATRMAGVYRNWTQLAAGEITAVPTARHTPVEYYGATPTDGITDNPLVVRPIPGGRDSDWAPISSWRKTTPTRQFFVYAGYLISDHGQGVVISQRAGTIFMDEYLVPKRSGAVRIVAEHGLYLELLAENGDIYYFDPEGCRFISSLDEPTVSATVLYPPPPYPYTATPPPLSTPPYP